MEEIILANLLENEDYSRKVLPHIKSEFFQDNSDKIVFELISTFINKYNSIPTKETLYIDLQNRDDLNEQSFEECQNIIASLRRDESTKLDWLIEHTEKFCQDKAIYLAIRKSIKILDSKSELTKAAIPTILQEALSVSFDSSVGHDFLENASDRWEFYHAYENKIPFGLHYLDKITDGGLPDKTLNMILAPTGVGKSALMCHMAASNLRNQHNVLYITLEMAEERIAERIDANLLDIDMKSLRELPKEKYEEKIDRLKQTCKGKLIIKEYPTTSAGANHFRHLLEELRIKKNFIPDIIYIDYLNICCSSRIKQGAGVNTYSYIKSIAEELRGLAVEYCLPIVSATQANRDAIRSSDIELDNTSDSIGLPMTVDFMIALISTEELETRNMILIKQLKNRYGDPSKNRRFVLGVDKSKMLFYDVNLEDQPDLIDGPSEEDNKDFIPKAGKKKFEGFK